MRVWTVLATGLWLCCWFVTTRGLMTMNDFQNEILPNCYSDDNDAGKYQNSQRIPIPKTLETFVSLVEKIEHSQKGAKMMDIVKLLLVTFRYDDLKYVASGNNFESRTTAATAAFDILKAIFNYPATKSASKLSDDVLTQDEKCALFFMISHNVNGTFRSGDDPISGGDNQPPLVRNPREEGVVMLNSDVDHAFALGKVLLGIFAASYPSEIESATVYSNLIKNERMNTTGLGKINVLYAATFGDLISASKELWVPENPNIFLLNGKWNDETCPTEYRVYGKEEFDTVDASIHTTYSSIRGAIDGYMLGSVVDEIVKLVPEIRLSQILRSYYGSRDLFDTKLPQTSFCFRKQYETQVMTDRLQDEAVAYDKLFSLVRRKSIPSNIKESIEPVFQQIKGHGRQIILNAHENSNCDTQTTGCDTDRNIVAIMDYRTSEDVKNMQRRIIGEFSSGMQMSMHGSSASVFTNLRPYGGANLDNVINRTIYSGCASCAIKYNTKTGGSRTDVEVIRDLNRTLVLLEEATTDERQPGVPAKVILYFNYGTVNNDWNLRNAIYDYRRQHRDARTLAFGSKAENLKIFVEGSEDIETSPTFTELTAKKLKDKICKIPALFQYKNCDRRTDADEMEDRYDGFISPNSVQYWAMYPKYFLKSYHIKLTFTAVTGVLKVCFSRYYSDIFEQKEPRGDCRDTSTPSGNAENTVEFYVKNPCHKYNVDNCDPFYFYIEEKSRLKSSTDVPYCTDERCKTIDQTQFQFTHQGISCNKGSFLTCTAATIFYATVAAIFWLFSSARCQ